MAIIGRSFGASWPYAPQPGHDEPHLGQVLPDCSHNVLIHSLIDGLHGIDLTASCRTMSAHVWTHIVRLIVDWQLLHVCLALFTEGSTGQPIPSTEVRNRTHGGFISKIVQGGYKQLQVCASHLQPHSVLPVGSSQLCKVGRHLRCLQPCPRVLQDLPPCLQVSPGVLWELSHRPCSPGLRCFCSHPLWSSCKIFSHSSSRASIRIVSQMSLQRAALQGCYKNCFGIGGRWTSSMPCATACPHKWSPRPKMPSRRKNLSKLYSPGF